jgi:hypothetical protein
MEAKRLRSSTNNWKAFVLEKSMLDKVMCYTFGLLIFKNTILSGIKKGV